jgi:hypothetical protein
MSKRKTSVFEVEQTVGAKNRRRTENTFFANFGKKTGLHDELQRICKNLNQGDNYVSRFSKE